MPLVLPPLLLLLLLFLLSTSTATTVVAYDVYDAAALCVCIQRYNNILLFFSFLNAAVSTRAHASLTTAELMSRHAGSFKSCGRLNPLQSHIYKNRRHPLRLIAFNACYAPRDDLSMPIDRRPVRPTPASLSMCIYRRQIYRRVHRL